MQQRVKKRLLPVLLAVAAALLLAKYFYTFFVFPGVPFGYDAGIYRFLFIRQGAGLPPFLTPDLPEWARSHAPGLFFFTSILTHIGITADMLIGWMWNLVPVAVACVLAEIIRRKEGMTTGFFTLVCALVSVVQFAGFEMMYYKVFVALGFTAAAFHLFASRSAWWALFGMLAIATHQQIGLVFVLAVLSSILSGWLLQHRKGILKDTAFFAVACVLGGLWYLPTYQRSLGDLLPQVVQSGTVAVLGVALMAIGIFGALLITLPRKDRRFLWVLLSILGAALLLVLPYVSDAPDLVVRYLFSRSDTAGGAFFSITEYIMLSAPLLLLGIIGLVQSAEQDRGTPWQWAALWCAVASLGMFFFYRRFLLPLDFFLLPFAASACALLWKKKAPGRGIVIAVLGLQAAFTLQHMHAADPHVKREWLDAFAVLHTSVPAGSQLIVLDNMAPWVLGYLPEVDVSGPGIFDSRPYDEWETFLFGTDADRRAFISQYPEGTFFYATDVFRTFYPPEVHAVLQNSCLKPAGPAGLFRSVCGR